MENSAGVITSAYHKYITVHAKTAKKTTSQTVN